MRGPPPRPMDASQEIAKWAQENEACLTKMRETFLATMHREKTMLQEGVSEMRAMWAECHSDIKDNPLPSKLPLLYLRTESEVVPKVTAPRRGKSRKNMQKGKWTKKSHVQPEGESRGEIENKDDDERWTAPACPSMGKRPARVRKAKEKAEDRMARAAIQAKARQDILEYDWDERHALDSAPARLDALKDEDPSIADCLDIVYFRHGVLMWADDTPSSTRRRRTSTVYDV
ncbi:Aste57867_18557 [Aphanomyces stellatus]|uniref:Aste57867_18557 protein n=1 Tax=Aphanomyces stellatus TaxID=120398 RepID=A0A485LAM6_9STRA|nr:hypothetical protein As57867_018495 [Aphanomyces stellatus]VFT95293.1 Aste57867_18557 [Aphanomyces stellatus]